MNVSSILDHLMSELRRKRPWQSYVVASCMTLGFFLLVQNVLGDVPELPQAEPEVAPATAPKVENFSLVGEGAGPSVWAVSTGAPTSLAAAEPGDAVIEAAEAAATVPASAEEPALPVGTPVEAASAVAAEFYADLDRSDLAAAYHKLSPEFQETLSFQRFENGYRSVEAVKVEVKREELLSSDTVRLDLQLDVQESGRPATYVATCIVTRRQQADWKLSGIAQLAAR